MSGPSPSGPSVVDKLNVSGGVLYRFAGGSDRSVGFLLVVLTQAETDDPDRRADRRGLA